MVADDYLYWLKNEKGIACDITDTGLECNSWVTRPWMYDEHLHPTNWATGRALDFLRRRDRDQPFLLMLSYVRPHAPYDPPACYYDMYKNKALAPPFSGDWDDLERLRREGRVFCNTTGPWIRSLSGSSRPAIMPASPTWITRSAGFYRG